MTSRVSFYKVMIEDLRHKIWMIALSCLGSFLAMPVAYLLVERTWNSRIEYLLHNPDAYTRAANNIADYKIASVREFFTGILPATGGIILIAGALIVGILGFRYVFSKKMIDQYHSIPITRRQLFLVHYVNGFLIWFVPMLLGAAFCAVMSGLFIQDFLAWMGVLGTLGMVIGSFVLAFLLVYHVALVAVMLSGNIINTLVSGTILSCFAVAAYAMLEGFAGVYFETYYTFFDTNIFKVLWASPLPAAIYQLCIPGIGDDISKATLLLHMSMSVALVILMWIAAFVLYLRRPSELSEQGMKIKFVQIVFKTAVTILAGMTGWILFDSLTGQTGWMIFGAVLAGILVYGVMDIIFQMDFKAFAAHKIQMAATVAAAILVGFTFSEDLLGYDSYLPDKAEIADMGIYISGVGQNMNYSAFGDAFEIKNRIANMEYEDADVIYAFLDTMAERGAGGEWYPENGSSTIAYVKITKTDGKTYYRKYRVWETDKELLKPVVLDKSYLESNVLIPDKVIDEMKLDESGTFRLYRASGEQEIDDAEAVQRLIRAYNEDFRKNPGAYLFNEDEVLANVDCWDYADDSYFSLYFDLYESMEGVKQVLSEYQYGAFLEKPEAGDLNAVIIEAYCYDTEDNLNEIFGTGGDIVQTDGFKAEAAAESYYGTTDKYSGDFHYQATITEPEDMQTILDIVSYCTPGNGNIWGEAFADCSVILEGKNGENIYVSMKKGALPEEFLQEFRLVN